MFWKFSGWTQQQNGGRGKESANLKTGQEKFANLNDWKEIGWKSKQNLWGLWEQQRYHIRVIKPQKERREGTWQKPSKKEWLKTAVWWKTSTYGFRKPVTSEQDNPKEILTEPHQPKLLNYEDKEKRSWKQWERNGPLPVWENKSYPQQVSHQRLGGQEEVAILFSRDERKNCQPKILCIQQNDPPGTRGKARRSQIMENRENLSPADLP